MRAWQLAIFCLTCLAVAGCRTDPAVALLERENRDLEDQLYQLADLVENCRRKNAALRGQLQCRETETGGPAVPGDVQSPTVELPSVEMPAERFLDRFQDQDPIDAPKTLPGPAESNPPKRTTPPEDGDPATGDASVVSPADNTRVALITLNDSLTGGCNVDGRAGDEGITVVIEPRGSDGRLVDAAAPVSIVVLDPALSGQATRLARWDFTADQIAATYHKTPSSGGIHLEMVWPGALPVHSQLQVFVRYTTDDGRKLEVDKSIDVDVIVRQARRLSSVGPSGPAPGASRTAARWQGRPSAVTRLPPTEPAPPASLPAKPADSVFLAAQPPPAQTTPKRQRPVWSPHRR